MKNAMRLRVPSILLLLSMLAIGFFSNCAKDPDDSGNSANPQITSFYPGKYTYKFVSCKGDASTGLVTLRYKMSHNLPTQSFQTYYISSNTDLCTDVNGKGYEIDYATVSGCGSGIGHAGCELSKDIEYSGTKVFAGFQSDVTDLQEIKFLCRSYDASSGANDVSDWTSFKGLKIEWN